MLHLGIFSLFFQQRNTIINPSTDTEILHVERLLLEPPPPAKPKQKKIIRAKIIPNLVPDSIPEEPEPEPEPEILLTAAPVEIPPPVKVNPVIKPLPPPVSKDSIRQVTKSYLRELRNQLEHHKVYPATARRLQQEGEVRIQFTIAGDGRIYDIRLAKSSEFSALDKSALQAVQSIPFFKPIPAILKKDFWNIEIPIQYQLHKGAL
jgi:protein TonB